MQELNAQKSPPNNDANTPVDLGDCTPQIGPTHEAEEDRAKGFALKAGLSKEEMLARLIFSEALSTGYWEGRCSANSDLDIFMAIGWGVMNRISLLKNQDDLGFISVIFRKGQFRTSFSSKKNNPFAVAFLCPLKADQYLKSSSNNPDAQILYLRTLEISKKIVDEFSQVGIPSKYSGITNFFYPYSSFYGNIRPPWAANKKPSKNRGYVNVLDVDDKPCVESYQLK